MPKSSAGCRGKFSVGGNTFSTNSNLSDTTATTFYARFSSAEQTAEHQRTQAEAAGFDLDEVVVDNGVSRVTTKLADRMGIRRLFDLLRAGDTLVVRWVDRLRRNYEDVSDNIRAFMRRGVFIWTSITGMTFDGATKAQCSRPCATR